MCPLPMWLYSMPMVGMLVTLSSSAINSRASASDPTYPSTGAHKSDVPAIAISSVPVENARRIGSSNRRRASVFRRVSRRYIGRQSYASPRLLGSSISAAENGRGEGGVVLSAGRAVSPPARRVMALGLSLQQRSGAPRRGGISTLSRPLGRSVGLSVSTRSIFISTPRAINLRHRALLRRLQASQRPSHPLTVWPGRLSRAHR